MTDSFITCECGAKLRLPEERENRAFRCPQCKKGVALTTAVKALPEYAGPVDTTTVCPICQTLLVSNDVLVKCPECLQVHHQECWSEIGGCGTYGCQEAPAIDKSDETAQRPMTAWGDTKTCPACGETIKAIALRCRYCKTEFDTVDPLSMRDLKRQSRKSDEIEQLQKLAVAYFVAAFIPCIAPLTLLIALLHLVPRKRDLARCGHIYQFMAWGAIAISAVFSVLILLFVLLEAVT